MTRRSRSAYGSPIYQGAVKGRGGLGDLGGMFLLVNDSETSQGITDWSLITESGEQLLTESSEDLRIE